MSEEFFIFAAGIFMLQGLGQLYQGLQHMYQGLQHKICKGEKENYTR